MFALGLPHGSKKLPRWLLCDIPLMKDTASLERPCYLRKERKEKARKMQVERGSKKTACRPARVEPIRTDQLGLTGPLPLLPARRVLHASCSAWPAARGRLGAHLLSGRPAVISQFPGRSLAVLGRGKRVVAQQEHHRRCRFRRPNCLIHSARPLARLPPLRLQFSSADDDDLCLANETLHDHLTGRHHLQSLRRQHRAIMNVQRVGLRALRQGQFVFSTIIVCPRALFAPAAGEWAAQRLAISRDWLPLKYHSMTDVTPIRSRG